VRCACLFSVFYYVVLVLAGVPHTSSYFCASVVGGSDLHKIKEQIGDDVIDTFDFVFSENGLMAYKDGQFLAEQSLRSHYTNEQIKSFVNFVLHYIADLDIPVKRGTFIEFRTGMINVSPIGRNCSQSERDEFEAYDKVGMERGVFFCLFLARQLCCIILPFVSRFADSWCAGQDGGYIGKGICSHAT
jgi:hypothetical protein